jgi:hypothetical protein
MPHPVLDIHEIAGLIVNSLEDQPLKKHEWIDIALAHRSLSHHALAQLWGQHAHDIMHLLALLPDSCWSEGPDVKDLRILYRNNQKPVCFFYYLGLELLLIYLRSENWANASPTCC